MIRRVPVSELKSFARLPFTDLAFRACLNRRDDAEASNLLLRSATDSESEQIYCAYVVDLSACTRPASANRDFEVLTKAESSPPRRPASGIVGSKNLGSDVWFWSDALRRAGRAGRRGVVVRLGRWVAFASVHDRSRSGIVGSPTVTQKGR